MRRTLISFVFILAASAVFACYRIPTAVPRGTWRYSLILNGSAVGEAVISGRFEKGRWITESTLTMRAGNVVNTSHQVVVESADFKPVSVVTNNTTVMGDTIQRVDTEALVDGLKVRLKQGGRESVITLEREFVLDGNYFLSKMIGAGFAEGAKFEAYVYDPSIEAGELMLMKARVEGKKLVTVNGSTYPSYHVVNSIENIKSIDSYFDCDGVMVKAELSMLNMRIQLLRQ